MVEVGLTSMAVCGRVAGVAIAALTVAAPACTSAREPDPATPQATPSTVAAWAPTDRPSCEAALPVGWHEAIESSAVSTGGISNEPVAVGRAGEVAVVRDNGDTRDLLLIDADKSVNQIYAVPEPSRNVVGSVAMDDRWIVVGVNRAPRGANGVLSTLTRIDVIDRRGGPVRTVVQSLEDDHRSGGKTLDSVALFGGKVYWITRAAFVDQTGAVSSYNLVTGAVADVPLGVGRDIRTSAAGLTWVVEGTGRRAEVKIPASLPAPVAAAVGAGQDQVTLVTDGTAYAWATGVDQGGTGVAWWSPNSGLVRVTDNLPPANHQEPLYVVGPYVVLDRGRMDGKYDTYATVVDTRSGAVTYLRESVGGAGGGTIAVGFGGTLKRLPSSAGILRTDALPPLSC